MKKRISAVLLALVMVLSLFPTSALAVGDRAASGTQVTAAGLPEGAELVVTPLGDKEASQYIAAIKDSGVTLTNALALDVSVLDANGKEWQPEKGKTVQLSFNQGFGANTAVWHFPTVNPAANAPQGTKGAGKLSFDELPVTNASGGSVTVETNGFSVYVIGEVQFLTVKFMNGDKELSSIKVKSADEVDGLVCEPNVALGDKEVFRGWTTKQDYTEADAEDTSVNLDIDGVRAAVKAELPVSADEEFPVYAMVYKTFTVTYMTEQTKDADGNDLPTQVVKTDTVLTKTGDPKDYTISESYSPNDPTKQAFLGWTPDKPDNMEGQGGATVPYQPEDKVTLKGDVTLLPEVPYGNWLIFEANGGSYTVPQFIKEGDTPTAPAAPTRKGYTFENWYTGAVGSVGLSASLTNCGTV